jgi:DNA-binding HxlR family transcriptional regulator
MLHKSFRCMPCPIARSLERVGEWWSMLIMRDALYGLARFDEFQKSLGIAPNMLARRLNALVEAGLLERHRYSVRPPRDEYRPTARGRDFRAVLIALLAFGNRHFAPEGASNRGCANGAEAEPSLWIAPQDGQFASPNSPGCRARPRASPRDSDMRGGRVRRGKQVRATPEIGAPHECCGKARVSLRGCCVASAG